jgi:hypothetical protein
MAGKAAFTDEEWEIVLEGPSTAGMLALTAASGGSFRETWALAKAYADARAQHGKSELLDEIVAAKPDFNRKKYGSAEQLREGGPAGLQQASALLEAKATPEEASDYRTFVLALAKRVAAAHKEEGESVSPPEQAALDEIASSLGVQAG